MLWLYNKQERNWQRELEKYRSRESDTEVTMVSQQSWTPPIESELELERADALVLAAAPSRQAPQGKPIDNIPVNKKRIFPKKQKNTATAQIVQKLEDDLSLVNSVPHEHTSVKNKRAKKMVVQHQSSTISDKPTSSVAQWERGLDALNQGERLPIYNNRNPAPKPLEHLHRSVSSTNEIAPESKAQQNIDVAVRGFTFELLEPENQEPPEIITLEEATRNLNLNNDTPIRSTIETTADKKDNLVEIVEEKNIEVNNDLEVITLEEALRSSWHSGVSTEAIETEVETVVPLEGEEIGLDEIMSSVRERTLATPNAPIVRKLPEDTETIGMDEIRASLLRQRQARRQQQMTEVPADSLNIIGEDEVLANLAHTDSPINRRRNKTTRGIPNAKAQPTAPAPLRRKATTKARAVKTTAVAMPSSKSSINDDDSDPISEDVLSRQRLIQPIKSLARARPSVVMPQPSLPILQQPEIIAPPIIEQPINFPEPPNYLAETQNNDWLLSDDGSLPIDNVDDAQWSEDEPIYPLPTADLLLPAKYNFDAVQTEEQLLENGITIEEKLAEFRVKVKVIDAYSGPVITRYEIEPDVGVRGSSVINLEKDLARSLGVNSIRVVETIAGKNCMGIELPNPQRQIISLREVLSAPEFINSRSKLTLALGQDIEGQPVVTDLQKAPHLLVAGTTGSGKSVGINSMIVSMLFKATPEDVRMIMIDPKMLELSIYEGIPHLLAPVVTDMKLAAHALAWCVNEMEKRYRLMSHIGVRNLTSYNQKIVETIQTGKRIANPFSLTPEDPEPLEKLPFIVVIVDEFADLMMTAGKKIEELIARLAQKARAAGIHLILATQRPSVDVITGLIKANIPVRIAFQVPTKTDSRTILDQMGAENLLGQGDMLFLPPGTNNLQRVHGAFVDDSEVHGVVEYLKQFGEPDYIEDIFMPATDDMNNILPIGGGERDPLFDRAVEIILSTGKVTVSFLQRQMRIGYNKAANLVEQMEAEGIVSSPDHAGKRTILMRNDKPENNL